MNRIAATTRRDFIRTVALAGGGMAIGIVSPSADAAPASGEFTPWLVIGADDIATVRVATAEIGNGVLTQAALNVAEELGAAWPNMRAAFADPRRDFMEKNVYSAPTGMMAYFSGRSTEKVRLGTCLQVGASARERLKAAAAKRWKVPATEIDAKDSVLTHRPTGRTLRFGQVAGEAAAIVLKEEPKPKPQSEWTLLGKSVPKLQSPSAVDGSAVYGIDVKLPGMVYAALKQSPVQGGRLKRYDAAAVAKMPGVRAVVEVIPGDAPKHPEEKPPFVPPATNSRQAAVAVIADHYWQAKKALDVLPVEWEDGDGAKWKTTRQMVDASMAALNAPPEKVEKKIGDPEAKMGAATKIVEATYHTPYCDQAQMEPLNGTALVTADRVEVWHPSQNARNGQYIAADETGIASERSYFNQTLVGGAFGRRVYGDDIRMVVAVAKQYPGRPVHTIWSREESMRQGRYRAITSARLKASLGADGLPEALILHASGCPGLSLAGIADSPIANNIIPHVLLQTTVLPFNVMSGPYRGPGYNSFAFMVESFIDECATAVGADPVAYRMKLHAKNPDPGYLLCLKEATSKAGWGKPLPKGTAQGVAIANWGSNGTTPAGTTVCAVATVDTSGGKVKVTKVDIAFDSGRIVNPMAVEAQMQGGVLFGLNMTLNEQLDIENGRVVQGNYDQYPILKIADAPDIDVHFGGLSGHERMAEVGEPPAGVIGPAVANAIFRATGRRLRTTPLRTAGWA